MREGDYQESYNWPAKRWGTLSVWIPAWSLGSRRRRSTSALEITAHDDRVVLLLAEALEMESARVRVAVISSRPSCMPTRQSR